MANHEHKFHPLVTATALGLGALAVSEFRKYQAHRHEFYNPLAYAKDRWLDVTAPFTDEFGTFSPDSIVAGTLDKAEIQS